MRVLYIFNEHYTTDSLFSIVMSSVAATTWSTEPSSDKRWSLWAFIVTVLSGLNFYCDGSYHSMERQLENRCGEFFDKISADQKRALKKFAKDTCSSGYIHALLKEHINYQFEYSDEFNEMIGTNIFSSHSDSKNWRNTPQYEYEGALKWTIFKFEHDEPVHEQVFAMVNKFLIDTLASKSIFVDDRNMDLLQSFVASTLSCSPVDCVDRFDFTNTEGLCSLIADFERSIGEIHLNADDHLEITSRFKDLRTYMFDCIETKTLSPTKLADLLSSFQNYSIERIDNSHCYTMAMERHYMKIHDISMKHEEVVEDAKLAIERSEVSCAATVKTIGKLCHFIKTNFVMHSYPQKRDDLRIAFRKSVPSLDEKMAKEIDLIVDFVSYIIVKANHSLKIRDKFKDVLETFVADKL